MLPVAAGMLADTFEAILGAMYQDNGIEAVRNFIVTLMEVSGGLDDTGRFVCHVFLNEEQFQIQD